MDDGSSDNGVDVVLSSEFTQVRIVQQNNQGVSVARNHGVAFARNDYVTFLDADDRWLPFYLEEMAQLIHKYPQVGIYASRYQCIEDGEAYVDPKIWLQQANPKGMLMNNYFEIASKGDLPFMISSTVVSKTLFNQIGGFPAGEKIGEDQDFFVRAALNGPIAYTPNIHLFYHKDTENKATLLNIPEQECPYSQRVNALVQYREFSEQESNHMLRYCAAHLCHIAKLNIKAGNIDAAKNLLADERCKLKPKHRIGLYLFALVKQGMNAVRLG